MLTSQQESPNPLFEPECLNISGWHDMNPGGEGVRFDFLGLPGVVTTEEPVYGRCTVQVKAEQVKVPTLPDCTCLMPEVKARFWEHEISQDLERCILRVEDAIAHQ